MMKQLNKKEIKKFFKKQAKRTEEIVLILENVEYARNVAGIFRSADAAGISHIYLTGISKTPPFGKDLKKASRSKEHSVKWTYCKQSNELIEELKDDDYTIIGAEITDNSIPLVNLKKIAEKQKKLAFIFGSEVFGIKKTTLELCDYSVYIPMYGKGASLNVAVSVGIILYSF